MIGRTDRAPVALPLVLIALAMLAGCKAGPDFVRPVPATPAHWSPQSTSDSTAPGAPATLRSSSLVTEQAPSITTWWDAFQDPKLSSLIERGVGANLDLQMALLRIEEARAQRDVSAAAFWPSVSLNASYARERLSESTPTGALFSSLGSLRPPSGAAVSIPNPYSQYQLGGAISWELDLFGRVRRGVESAEATVQAQQASARGMQVALAADIAESYLRLRGAQGRLEVARQSTATLDELLELARDRHAAGVTTELDVSSAEAQAGAMHSQLSGFALQIALSINQLSQLLAREPDALRAELEAAAPLPAAPQLLPVGLPADLARRRPDIGEAEARLHVATAQIGVAIGSLYPRLVLSAAGGFQAESASQLLKWASRFGTVGPSLQIPVFDRGQWKTVRLYKLREQEAALNYQRTVINALHEVEDAIVAVHAEQDRRAWLQSTVAQNSDTLSLARQRYGSGLVTFVEVLDAERGLEQTEMSLAESDTNQASALVHLYRALGGGWPADGAAPAQVQAP